MFWNVSLFSLYHHSLPFIVLSQISHNYLLLPRLLLKTMSLSNKRTIQEVYDFTPQKAMIALTKNIKEIVKEKEIDLTQYINMKENDPYPVWFDEYMKPLRQVLSEFDKNKLQVSC